jgi:hypothetical protein|nr:MAG TPA: hypothetical protein [Caudoviricetes sp.]
MNGVQLTNHLTAQFRASTLSLKRLKRKCGRYAKRERKAIEYVTTLKEES